MDRNHIESNNIIERYLLGKLDDQETADFEDAFAFDPDLQKEIDVAERLINGLTQIHHRENHNSTDSKVEKSSNDPANVSTIAPTEIEKRSSNPVSWLPLSLAANVIMAIGGGYWLLSSSPPSLSDNRSVSIVNAPTLTLEYSRGSGTSPARITYNKDWLFLSISTPSSGGKPQRISIINSMNNIVLQESKFNYDPLNPWIEWVVKGELLQPGSYSVVVTPGGTLTSQEPFKLPFDVCPASSSEQPGC